EHSGPRPGRRRKYGPTYSALRRRDTNHRRRACRSKSAQRLTPLISAGHISNRCRVAEPVQAKEAQVGEHSWDQVHEGRRRTVKERIAELPCLPVVAAQPNRRSLRQSLRKLLTRKHWHAMRYQFAFC